MGAQRVTLRSDGLLISVGRPDLEVKPIVQVPWVRVLMLTESLQRRRL